MATSSSSSRGSKSSGGSTHRRTAHVIGAVAGAVIGGVLGVLAVKKVRDGSAKRLMPAKAPALAKQARGAVKNFAQDAKRVAKATMVIAADAAMEQVKKAAEQFAVDVVSGQPPTMPKPPSPIPGAADTPIAVSEKSAAPSEEPQKKRTAPKTPAKKPSTAPKKSRVPKAAAKSAKPAVTRNPR